MRLFIPPLGTQLKLISDWEFKLECEYRNFATHCALSNNQYVRNGYWEAKDDLPLPCRLSTETVLSVERIYIRQGSADYDSVTFRVLESPDPRLRTKKAGGSFPGVGKPRFWASLHEVNKLDVVALEP